MVFDPELAEIRFGCGLAAQLAPPSDVAAMLARLQGPDVAAHTFAIPGLDTGLATAATFAKLRRAWRKSREGEQASLAKQAFRKYRRQHVQQQHLWFRQSLLRQCQTRDGFRERLVLFWADHFTAQGKRAALRPMGAPYVESAIRPHLAGRFEDLLIAAVTSPLMLHYLDQHRSIGPNSRAARRRKGRGGLNENLAREVMELHTLGVDGPYGQQDVRQLAELFTGLNFNAKKGFAFRGGQAEPGSETVLGVTYGADEGKAELGPILQVLRDLAAHPATAAHLARKLAVHFTRDDPDPGLVADLTESYIQSGGDLTRVYETLLQHPASWEPELNNIKPPQDFVASACRGLGIGTGDLADWKAKQLRRVLVAPLGLMGQRWQAAPGPDGWPEEDTAWITPQGLSARLRWAMAAPQKLRKDLPDPLRFAEQSLGQRADARVRFVAGAAETRAEAIGLILASPAFQRR
ncbi:DUF1800 domain-containing protein [Pseudophaeobacter sp.]|uniref:DUF1800 domain-containing protein n=1 Tax=Pseudophaeobacter sp. TaxID=1971739 RepID=UPI0032980BA1